MRDHLVYCILALLVLEVLCRRLPGRTTREPWTGNASRIVLVDGAGNVSIGPAMRDVSKFITDKHAHSIAHTEARHKAATAHADHRKNEAVAHANAQHGAAVKAAVDHGNAAKAHADHRKNEAVAHANNVGNSCVKKDHWYRMRNKDGNRQVLKWGDHIKADGGGGGNYRYFKLY